jgi:hypothetical protein
LARTTEHLVRDRVKFRIGSIVYVALSRDETRWAPARRAVGHWSRPTGAVLPPDAADGRYHWVQARLAAPNADELRTSTC